MATSVEPGHTRGHGGEQWAANKIRCGTYFADRQGPASWLRPDTRRKKRRCTEWKAYYLPCRCQSYRRRLRPSCPYSRPGHGSPASVRSLHMEDAASGSCPWATGREGKGLFPCQVQPARFCCGRGQLEAFPGPSRPGISLLHIRGKLNWLCCQRTRACRLPLHLWQASEERLQIIMSQGEERGRAGGSEEERGVRSGAGRAQIAATCLTTQVE